MKMRNTCFGICKVLPGIMGFVIAACLAVNQYAGANELSKPEKEEVVRKIQTLQVPFIANEGQTDERVRYYANTFGGTVLVTKDGEIVYALLAGSKRQDAGCEIQEMEGGADGQGCGKAGVHPQFKIKNQKSEIGGIVLKEQFIGGRIIGIRGGEQSETIVNYFKGNNPSKWKSSISTYNVVDMGEVYDGIGLSLKAHGNNVEKLFTVKPGADPGKIRIRLDGVQPTEPPFANEDDRNSPLIKGERGLSVNEQGELEAETELGVVKFTKPVAYQEIDGKRVSVAVEYCIHSSGIDGTESRGAGPCGGKGESGMQNSKPETQNPKHTYAFTVASYDKTRDLIIDPLLKSTFIGGDNNDYGYSMTIGKGGIVYVTGATLSPFFPTGSNAYDTSHNGGHDVFVSRFNSALTSLVASTFLGGGSDDYGHSMAIGAHDIVYVTGYTESSDFPTTIGAYDTSFNYGIRDGFVSGFDSGLTSLVASTFLGGYSYDSGASLSIDAGGKVSVTGYTESDNFPTTLGAYDTSFNGGSDVFVSRFNSGLTKLLASTFLGGTLYDNGTSLSIEAGGNVYVTGFTSSTNFPTTPGSYDTSHNGSQDVFVSRFNSGLTSLLASTYLGQWSDDVGSSLVIDGNGDVCVTGTTLSPNFPTTPGAYRTFNYGVHDVFVSKFNSGLTSLLASTLLGGNSDDYGYSMAIGPGEMLCVTGATLSTDFPKTPGAYDASHNGVHDVFVSKFNSGLTSLVASTFLGGSSDDYGYSMAIYGKGKGEGVYVTGYTGSTTFPTTTGAYDTSHNGSNDVFVSRIDSNFSIGATLTAIPDHHGVRGSPVTCTAGVQSGSGDTRVYEYKFFRKLSTDANYIEVCGYSTNNKWVWDTRGFAAGIYLIEVWVRTVGSPLDFEASRTAKCKIP